MSAKKIGKFALALGAVGGIVWMKNRRDQINRDVAEWQKRQQLDLDVLACPTCHGPLTLAAFADGQGLDCPSCQKTFQVIDGIPHFIEHAQLTGWNHRFSQMYDWLSWGYRAFSAVAFAYIGMSEEQARREVTDRLDPKGGPVLEVSIGPGVNLPYLVKRPDIGPVRGLDISLGQLQRCREFAAQKAWNVALDLGNAEQLPYRDNYFAGVMHIGGINFFNDKQKAIAEMIRVAKPGARILICDENERGAQAYEKFVPNFKKSVGTRQPVVPPADLVPPEMLDLRVSEVWNGWMYCIEFTKPPLVEA